MKYSDSLRLLCDILQRQLIPVRAVSLSAPISQIFDQNFLEFSKYIYNNNVSFQEFIGIPEDGHIYKMKDRFGLCYLYFLLPESDTDSLLFIGPYITAPMQEKLLIEFEEREGIPPQYHKLLTDYYSSLPVLSDHQHFLITVEVFAEKIIGHSPLTIIDKNLDSGIPASPINVYDGERQIENTLLDMSIMEHRYRFENDLMEAVSQGRTSKTDLLLESFPESPFEKRHADPVRNLKNYCIIMNTLLRKAAEKGGVHPVYLDSISSQFAIDIEQLSFTSEGKFMMQKMFHDYCRLVRKHSMKNYSPTVRKAVILIESDLSANLTLSSIAAVQNISSGYLSAVFKKETGQTVTEFIVEKRIQHAIHLLSTTNLQIQTVALHCGVMDVQYFSKLFKKYTGKTPKEFRATNAQAPESKGVFE